MPQESNWFGEEETRPEKEQTLIPPSPRRGEGADPHPTLLPDGEKEQSARTARAAQSRLWLADGFS